MLSPAPQEVEALGPGLKREHTMSTELATAWGLSLTSQLRQPSLPQPPTSFPPWAHISNHFPSLTPLLTNRGHPAFSPGRQGAGREREVADTALHTGDT